MERDIRRHKVDPSCEVRTQAGQVFAGLLQRLSEKAEVIFVSFDVDVINSKWMPGVSAPSVIGGLTSEEALEIVQVSGRSPKVRLVDFS
jgi:arginase family enzyme